MDRSSLPISMLINEDPPSPDHDTSPQRHTFNLSPRHTRVEPCTEMVLDRIGQRLVSFDSTSANTSVSSLFAPSPISNASEPDSRRSSLSSVLGPLQEPVAMLWEDTAAIRHSLPNSALGAPLEPLAMSLDDTITFRRGSSGGSSPSNYCAQCHQRNCKVPEHKKIRKEKKSRMELSRTIQMCEDLLETLGGVDRSKSKSQTSGNGTVSGLSYAKIETMCGMIAVTAHLMRKLRDQAIINDHLGAFEAENNRVFQDALKCDHPLIGASLIRIGDQACDHYDRNQICYVHGRANWTHCRKERTMENVRKHDLHIKALASLGLVYNRDEQQVYNTAIHT